MSSERERRRDKYSPQRPRPSSQQLTARPNRPSSEQCTLDNQGERSASNVDQDFLSICLGQSDSCISGSSVAAVETQLKNIKVWMLCFAYTLELTLI